MPIGCFSSYVLEGNEQEIKKLNETLDYLTSRKQPTVKNDFGNNWLGCLVDALGGDWHDIYCRGSWDDKNLEDNTLRLTTETAWGPMNEVFDFICQIYPSIKYYFCSEESMMGEFYTNDKEGKYFPDRYQIELCTPEDEYENEYFETLEEALQWLTENYCPDTPLHTEEDIEIVFDKWNEESDNAYLNLHEYVVVD